MGRPDARMIQSGTPRSRRLNLLSCNGVQKDLMELNIQKVKAILVVIALVVFGWRIDRLLPSLDDGRSAAINGYNNEWELKCIAKRGQTWDSLIQSNKAHCDSAEDELKKVVIGENPATAKGSFPVEICRSEYSFQKISDACINLLAFDKTECELEPCNINDKLPDYPWTLDSNAEFLLDKRGARKAWPDFLGLILALILIWKGDHLWAGFRAWMTR